MFGESWAAAFGQQYLRNACAAIFIKPERCGQDASNFSISFGVTSHFARSHAVHSSLAELYCEIRMTCHSAIVIGRNTTDARSCKLSAESAGTTGGRIDKNANLFVAFFLTESLLQFG
jgi:hypothetical protein